MFKEDYEKVKKFCENNGIDMDSFERETFYKVEKQYDIEDIQSYCEDDKNFLEKDYEIVRTFTDADFDRIAEIYRNDYDCELGVWENVYRAIEEYIDIKNRGEQI